MAQAGAAGHSAGRYKKYRTNEKRKRFNQTMLCVAAGLIVIALFVHIGQMARISGAAKDIDALEKEITRLEEQQIHLELMLATRQDIDRIRDEATVRLGMKTPSDKEVRRIPLEGYRK